MLRLSDNLFLIRSTFAGAGKTQNMAKGLILCHKDTVFAGESAGFGLPALKTADQTIFPSLFSATSRKNGIIDAIYHLNLANTWQVLGISAPLVFSTLMEKVVDFYMSRPEFQLSALKIRALLLKGFRIRSVMRPGKNFGCCRVRYRASDLRLEIKVNGAALQKGKLILLNEVTGTEFSRVKTKERIFNHHEFLPWQTCTLDTAIESPDCHIGFFLSLPGNQRQTDFHLSAGREVSRDLNWAGLAIAANTPVFAYYVNFY